MPTLVNYSGDDDFNDGRSYYSNDVDMGRLLSVSSNVDVYFPPSKRSRINAPIISGMPYFESVTRPSIKVIPDECLFEIFRRLPSAKERSTCACVSKQWLMLMSSIRRSEMVKGAVQSTKATVESSMIEEIIKDSDDVHMGNADADQLTESDGYLTRCLEGKKATDVRLAAMAVGTSGRGGLGKLSILGSNSTRGVTDLGLAAISRHCPSLRSLSLWNVSSVGDEGLLEIAKECHLLEKLDLCKCPSISNKGLIAIAERCPNLSVLNIESCPKIGNEGLQAIGKFSSKLQSISVRDCPLIGDRGVSSLFTSASSALTKVKLHGLNITDFCLAVIGHYGAGLTNLVLSGLQRVGERGFWVMANGGLKNLSSITITSCRGITDASLAAMGKGFTSLKHMSLRKCCFVSDIGLVNFAKSAVLLEGLHLEECNRVSIMGINGAISTLKSLILVKCMGIKDESLELPISRDSPLRSLAVRNCPGFGSGCLSMIGKFCPLLRHVELRGLCGLTDDGVLPLFESSEGGLVKVNLSGCSNLTDATVVGLTRLHGGTLEQLNLGRCRKITDLSLVAISENCALLNDLDVSDCAISDSGLAVVSKADPICLRVLSVSGCSGVSNKSLPFLERLGKTLVGLNLQNCRSVSSSTAAMLVERLWRCDILV